MQIELGDSSLTSKNIVASIFALCQMMDSSPRDMAEQLFAGLPDEQEWEDSILPHILNFPEDYETLT